MRRTMNSFPGSSPDNICKLDDSVCICHENLLFGESSGAFARVLPCDWDSGVVAGKIGGGEDPFFDGGVFKGATFAVAFPTTGEEAVDVFGLGAAFGVPSMVSATPGVFGTAVPQALFVWDEPEMRLSSKHSTWFGIPSR